MDFSCPSITQILVSFSNFLTFCYTLTGLYVQKKRGTSFNIIIYAQCDFLFCFVLFCLFEAGSHSVVQAGLELLILLPQPPAGITGMYHHFQLSVIFSMAYAECNKYIYTHRERKNARKFSKRFSCINNIESNYIRKRYNRFTAILRNQENYVIPFKDSVPNELSLCSTSISPPWELKLLTHEPLGDKLHPKCSTWEFSWHSG
jgi:hypothetical protein